MLNDINNNQLQTLPTVLQATNSKGKLYPVAYYSESDAGEKVRRQIDCVVDEYPHVEKGKKIVGRCYKCIVNGKPEFLFYSASHPQMWYRIIPKLYEQNKSLTDSSVQEVWHCYHRYLPQ